MKEKKIRKNILVEAPTATVAGLFLVVMVILAITASMCHKKEKIEPKSDMAAIISDLSQMSKEERGKFFLAVVPLVLEEAKNNPPLAQIFLPEMINLAVKDSPGLALKMEILVSEELRNEVNRWKNDSNVSNLLKLEQEKKQLLVVKDEYEKLKKKFAELEERLDLQKIKGVPVICCNSWLTTSCTIKATEEKTGNVFTTFLPPNEWQMLDVIPGEYSVEYRQGTENHCYARETITVTSYISAVRKFSYYENNVRKSIDKEGHAIFATPP